MWLSLFPPAIRPPERTKVIEADPHFFHDPVGDRSCHLTNIKWLLHHKVMNSMR